MEKDKRKIILIGLCLILTFLPLLSAFPTPTIIQNEGWQVTQDTESDYFGFEFEKNKQQTQICVLSETATKLNDLPIHFTYTNLETNETEQLNRKKVKDTDSGLERDYYGFCRNFHTEKKIKFGDNPIIYEFLNTTRYDYDEDELDLNPFMDNEISFLCNDIPLDITWQSNQPIKEGIKFDAFVNNFSCNGKLTARETNPIVRTPLWNSQFGGDTEERKVNFSPIETSPLNNITSQNTSTTLPSGWDGWYYCVGLNPLNPTKWYSCMNEPRYYNTDYYGTFTDLDPSLDVTITTTNLIDWQDNRTEGTYLGERTETPILFMNFNKDAEGTYVQDNSIYNNFGTNVGATWNSSCGITSAGNDLGGCYEFDGSTEYLLLTSHVAQFSSATDGTISGWFKQSSAVGNDVILGISDVSGSQDGLFVGTLDGTIRFRVSNNAVDSIYFTSTSTFNDGAWHSIVVRGGAGGNSIWVDGASVAGTYATGTSSTTTWISSVDEIDDFSIGVAHRFSNFYEYFDGSIDNVQIFNRALSDSEILNLYNGTTNNTDYVGKYANEGNFTSLVFYNSTSTYWNVTQSIADSDGAWETDDICEADANCIAYWALDENYLDSKASNDGTATGTNNATGISSGAMYFDGVDDKINVGTMGSFGSQVNNSAISLWVKTDSTTLSSFVEVIDTVGDDEVFAVEANYRCTTCSSCGEAAGWTSIFIRDSSSTGASTFSFDDTVYDNKWHHIIFNMNDVANDDITAYLDGTEVTGKLDCSAYTEDTFVNWAEDLYIGAQNNMGTPGQFFDGSIDEVLLYNNSLTDSEIESLYKAGLSQHADTNVSLQTRVATGYNISDAGLVGLWGLNGNANDELGVSNGTLEGSATTNKGNGTVGEGFTAQSGAGFVEINGSYQGFNFSDQGFAVSYWINPKDWAAESIWKPIITKREAYESKNDWGFWKDNTGGDLMLIYGNNAQVGFVTDYTSIPEGEWTYMSWVRNNNDLELYLNGIFVESQTLSATLSFNSDIPIKISSANHPTEYTQYFDGAIDEVRIYNRSLSATEVQNLYELGSYHIEWNDWTDEGVKSDGIPKMTAGMGNFLQFRDVFATNDTDVSAYVLNYSVSPGTAPPTPDTKSPTWSNNKTNLTTATPNGDSVYFNITFQDETASGDYIFSWYNTTSWANDSLAAWTNNTEIQVTKQITATSGQINWTWYFNDSASNDNQTDEWSVTLIADSPPYWLAEPTDISVLDNTTILGINNVTDDNGVDDCWTNETFLDANSTNYFNITSLTPGTYSINLSCNDTIGQVNSTFFNIEINTSSQITIGSIYPTADINVSRNEFFNYTVNITCLYSDCGEINVSLDPLLGSGTSDTYFDNGGDDYIDSADYLSTGYLRFTDNDTLSGCYQTTDYSGACWALNPCVAVNGLELGSGAGDSFIEPYEIYDTEVDCLAVEDGNTKSGLVSTTPGATPFYTNDTNPRTINLNASQSQLVTFWVNATGTVNTTHEFYAYVNLTNYTYVNDEGTHYNITIIEGNTAPVINSVKLNATSADNFTVDNLTGYVNVTDSNSDDITLWYNWYKDNNLNATTLIESGLVSYYPLDNDVLDYYGSNDGINTGATRNTTSYVLNASYTFDGTNDYITVPDIDLDAVSISFWINPNSLTADMGFVTKWEEAGGDNAFRVWYEQATDELQLDIQSSGGSVTIADAANLVTDNWQHIVGTYDTSGIYLYHNNVQVAGTAAGIPAIAASTLEIYIGGQNDTFRLFNGSIDEVQIYNRSLTAIEISQLYYGSVYGGDIMDSSQTTVGDEWILGVLGGDSELWGNETNSSIITIISDNVAPTNPTPILESEDLLNSTMAGLNCSSTITDPNGDAMNLTVTWYKDDVLNLTNNYLNIVNGTTFMDNLSVGNLTIGDTWICGMGLTDGTLSSDQVNSTALTIVKQNTSLLGVKFDLPDFIFDDTDYVLAGTFGFNTSDPNIGMIILSSFNIKNAVGGTGDVTVWGKIFFDDVEVHEEELANLVWLGGATDIASTGFQAINFTAVAPGEHNISFYFKEVAANNKPVTIYNVEVSLGKLDTSENNSVNGSVQPFTTSVSSQTLTSVYNFTVERTYPSGGYHSVKLNYNASAETNLECKLEHIGEDNVRPYTSGYLSSASDTGDFAISFITNELEDSHNVSLSCLSTSGATVDISGKFVDFALRDNGGNFISANQSSNPLTNQSNSLTLGAGNHVLTNQTLYFGDKGDSAMVSATATFISTTGSQTPTFSINSSINSSCSAEIDSYVSGNNIGEMFIYVICDDSPAQFSTQWVALNVEIEAGESINLLGESLNSFEIQSFDTTTTNTAPIVAILTPSKDESIYGTYNLTAAISDSQGDNFLHNVTLTNATGTYDVFTNQQKENLSYLFDTTTFEDGTYNLTWIACENDTTDLFCGNNTHAITIAQAPSVTIVYPVDGTTYLAEQTILNYIVDGMNLDVCWYSIDAGVTNSTPVAAETNFTGVAGAEGSNTWTVYCNDSYGMIGTDSVTFYIDITNPLWSNNETNITGNSGESNVYFNITFTDNYGSGNYTFSWYNGTLWQNDSAVWTNNTEIEVVKNINLGAGIINWTWYFNDSVGNTNQTDEWSQIINPIPIITNIYPVDGTNYTSLMDNSTFDVEFGGVGDKCWYSLDGGITNSTQIDCNSTGSYNFSSVPFVLSINTITIYANGTEGFVGSTSSTFIITSPPTLISATPENNSYQNVVLPVNMVYTNYYLVDFANYSIDGGENVSYDGTTNIYLNAGSHNITFYLGDNLNNTNILTHYFSVLGASTNLTEHCNMTTEEFIGFYENSSAICIPRRDPTILPTVCNESYEKLVYNGSAYLCVNETDPLWTSNYSSFLAMNDSLNSLISDVGDMNTTLNNLITRVDTLNSTIINLQTNLSLVYSNITDIYLNLSATWVQINANNLSIYETNISLNNLITRVDSINSTVVSLFYILNNIPTCQTNETLYFNGTLFSCIGNDRTIIVSPREETYYRDGNASINSECNYLNSSACDSSIVCKLTSFYPNNTALLNRTTMSYLSNGWYQYNFTNLSTVGFYSSYVDCFETKIQGGAFTFEVNSPYLNPPDTTPPEITLVVPTSTTYAQTTLNFSLTSNENLSTCFFSLDNYLTNNTMLVNGTNATRSNFFIDEGNYTGRFNCNDTIGNVNITTVLFTILLTPDSPEVSPNSGSGGSTSSSSSSYNATFICEEVEKFLIGHRTSDGFSYSYDNVVNLTDYINLEHSPKLSVSVVESYLRDYYGNCGRAVSQFLSITTPSNLSNFQIINTEKECDIDISRTVRIFGLEFIMDGYIPTGIHINLGEKSCKQIGRLRWYFKLVEINEGYYEIKGVKLWIFFLAGTLIFGTYKIRKSYLSWKKENDSELKRKKRDI